MAAQRARSPRQRESEHLLRRIGTLVRETESLRRSGASGKAVDARRREIDRLKSRLADVVRRDPTGGDDAWGRGETAPWGPA